MNRIAALFQKGPKVLRAGHPSLRLKADPVPPSDITSHKITRVITDMRSVFTSPYTPVVGLAAPQVGHPYRIIAYELSDSKLLAERKIARQPLTFLINPQLTILSPQHKWTEEYESCESVPRYNGRVKRAMEVKVEALDLEGKKVSIHANGFLARVLQHECDHLDGRLFVDIMDSKSFRADEYIDKYEVYSKNNH
ncbi:hypothetical protein PhCBS80983_g00619 [Powellomyces hirtus]|uniref:Peptide deformylase n=1 Tax=Powellomyces hirtus TaxID=109895 RepID=A0A507ED27_9FUNG|nr:hypothetical protein PhCBS80983_g00619 [Powellomyces hirtus]